MNEHTYGDTMPECLWCDEPRRYAQPTQCNAWDDSEGGAA